ncbi:heavy-metal-associated domain-containing protein [Pseudaminobacter sp. NGMCC 1.201702]|uniref:heavy-metal-associated domain-containing protein n=1 Tax=Pseudaminobacter sp. NGMCC 1.201702 TaxID=3391825 RepID=UPI0039EE767C
MKYLPQIAVAVVAVGVGGFALFAFAPARTGLPARTDKPALVQVAATERIQSFAIDNMYCASCPIIVRRAIERVEGVRSVTVDFANKAAIVVYDPSVTTVDAIADAPTRLGYPAKAIGS